MLKVANKNKLLVMPLVSNTELGNGISITNETQSRKDIIKGKVIDGEFVNQIIYFPLYAGLPLSYKGDNYLVVDLQDVLVYDPEDN